MNPSRRVILVLRDKRANELENETVKLCATLGLDARVMEGGGDADVAALAAKIYLSGARVVVAFGTEGDTFVGRLAGLLSIPVLAVPFVVEGGDPVAALRAMTAPRETGAVGCLALGLAGAKNAAFAAASIVGVSDDNLRADIEAFRARQAEEIVEMRLPV